MEMKKITELDRFDAEEFCLKPRFHGMTEEYTYNAKQEFEEAKRLAADVDGICIAIIGKENGTPIVLADSVNKGCSQAFILFNAEIVSNGEIHAITYNTGSGALTRYWTDEYVRYKPGSLARF